MTFRRIFLGPSLTEKCDVIWEKLINILLHANAKTGKGLNIDSICLETIKKADKTIET